MMRLKYKLVFSIAVLWLVIGVPIQAKGMSLAAVEAAINWNCIGFQIIGLCYRPVPPYIGLRIRYWEPVLLIETVKKPGDTIITGLENTLASLTETATETLLSTVTQLSFPITSGSSSQPITESNLQFNEAHVYAFPFPNLVLNYLSMRCSGGELPQGSFIKYLSELDAPEWRIGLLEALSPKSIASAALGAFCAVASQVDNDLCMGFWGPTYPRRGAISHQSEVVGSAATAFRAVSIVGLDNIAPHVFLEQVLFVPSPSKDKLQLIYPVTAGCIKIGQNPVSWEMGKTSKDGKYLWVYWRHRECCYYFD